MDLCADPAVVRAVAARREGTVCISGLTGEGMDELLERVSHKLQVRMGMRGAVHWGGTALLKISWV